MLRPTKANRAQSVFSLGPDEPALVDHDGRARSTSGPRSTKSSKSVAMDESATLEEQFQTSERELDWETSSEHLEYLEQRIDQWLAKSETLTISRSARSALVEPLRRFRPQTSRSRIKTGITVYLYPRRSGTAASASPFPLQKGITSAADVTEEYVAEYRSIKNISTVVDTSIEEPGFLNSSQTMTCEKIVMDVQPDIEEMQGASQPVDKLTSVSVSIRDALSKVEPIFCETGYSTCLSPTLRYSFRASAPHSVRSKQRNTQISTPTDKLGRKSGKKPRRPYTAEEYGELRRTLRDAELKMRHFRACMNT
ncbi:unnamed protein product, partial [Dicrocoelium dendriticum]